MNPDFNPFSPFNLYLSLKTLHIDSCVMLVVTGYDSAF